MYDRNEIIQDQSDDKQELLSLDLNATECYQALGLLVEGRSLQMIVPLSFDGTRVGEVADTAVAGETFLLLCRQAGLLVVDVPRADVRHRAVIAHTTFREVPPGITEAGPVTNCS